MGVEDSVQDVAISTDKIALDALLKWSGVAGSGGQAKALIQGGAVSINGRQETRRSHKVEPGDQIGIEGYGKLRVTRRDESPDGEGS